MLLMFWYILMEMLFGNENDENDDNIDYDDESDEIADEVVIYERINLYGIDLLG